MFHFKKLYFLPIALTVINTTISFQAHAWTNLDSSYKVCNNFNYSLEIKKTSGYQMNTNNDHSADQVVNANQCVIIDFWAQWQSNGYDLDDALDFSVQSNGNEVGKFTIFVNSYLDGLTYSIKNNSNFVKHKYSGSSGHQGLINFE